MPFGPILGITTHDSLQLHFREHWKEYIIPLILEKSRDIVKVHLEENEARTEVPLNNVQKYPDIVIRYRQWEQHDLGKYSNKVIWEKRNWHGFETTLKQNQYFRDINRPSYLESPKPPEDVELYIDCSLCGERFDGDLYCYRGERTALVEVKTRIDKYGAYVRQVHEYQRQLPRALAVIFTPDWSRDKDLLRDGIQPLHPRENWKLEDFNP